MFSLIFFLSLNPQIPTTKVDACSLVTYSRYLLDLSWYLPTNLPRYLGALEAESEESPDRRKTKKTRGTGRENGQDQTMFAN